MVARLLIAAGANVNAVDKDHSTSLLAMTRERHRSEDSVSNMMRLLLSVGADVHIRDCKQRTVLHRANTVEQVERLLDCGADVNAMDNEGNTPLHVAASNGIVDVVETLIRSGARAWLVNDEGQTAADVFKCYSWNRSSGEELKRTLTSLAYEVSRLLCTHHTVSLISGVLCLLWNVRDALWTSCSAMAFLSSDCQQKHIHCHDPFSRHWLRASS